MSPGPREDQGPGGDGDPIARNPKDVARPEEAIQPAEVHRRVAPTALAVGGGYGGWGVSPSPQNGPSPMELLASILRFKWTIVLVFLLVSPPIIALIWTRVVPTYQARAEIRVRPYIPRLVFRTDENGAIPFYDSFVNTQVSIIRGPTVLGRVLDQKEVRDTEWYKRSLGVPEEAPEATTWHGKTLQWVGNRLRKEPVPALELLRDSLSVRPRPRTEITDVSFVDVSSADARVILNSVLTQYRAYISETSSTDDRALRLKLIQQQTSLSGEIDALARACAANYEKLGTQTPQELISTKRIALEQMQQRLAELTRTIAMLESEVAKTEVAVDGNDAPVDVASQPKYHTDADWRRLDLQVRELEHQISASIRSPTHPDMVRLTKDLEFAKELRELRESQLDEEWRDRPLAPVMALTPDGANGTALYGVGPVSARGQLARAQQEKQLLEQEYQKQDQEFKTLFRIAQDLDATNNDLRHKRELHDAVRQRLDIKNVEDSAAVGSIEVLTAAFSPSEPSQDRRVVFTAMALFLGLGLGGGVAFLRAHRDQSVYVVKDMPQSVQVMLLGHVPLVRTNKSSGRLLYDESGQEQLPLVESVRVMRTALLSRLNGKQGTTVLVTSAAPGTGKSSFTMVLGKSLAQAGKRVLLIDADFHKMTLSRWFELLDRPGFLDALENKSVGMRHIFPTENPNLFVMPAGDRGEGRMVFEETANGAFKTCMKQLAEQYSIILLDGSPILPVADSTILAGQVDGAIMVERGNVSRRADIAEALARFSSAGGRLLGTVFVGTPARAGYGYHYGYGYGYHSQNLKPGNQERPSKPV